MRPIVYKELPTVIGVNSEARIITGIQNVSIPTDAAGLNFNLDATPDDLEELKFFWPGNKVVFQFLTAPNYSAMQYREGDEIIIEVLIGANPGETTTNLRDVMSTSVYLIKDWRVQNNNRIITRKAGLEFTIDADEVANSSAAPRFSTLAVIAPNAGTVPENLQCNLTVTLSPNSNDLSGEMIGEARHRPYKVTTAIAEFEFRIDDLIKNRLSWVAAHPEGGRLQKLSGIAAPISLVAAEVSGEDEEAFAGVKHNETLIAILSGARKEQIDFYLNNRWFQKVVIERMEGVLNVDYLHERDFSLTNFRSRFVYWFDFRNAGNWPMRIRAIVNYRRQNDSLQSITLIPDEMDTMGNYGVYAIQYGWPMHQRLTQMIQAQDNQFSRIENYQLQIVEGSTVIVNDLATIRHIGQPGVLWKHFAWQSSMGGMCDVVAEDGWRLIFDIQKEMYERFSIEEEWDKRRDFRAKMDDYSDLKEVRIGPLSMQRAQALCDMLTSEQVFETYYDLQQGKYRYRPIEIIPGSFDIGRSASGFDEFFILFKYINSAKSEISGNERAFGW